MLLTMVRASRPPFLVLTFASVWVGCASVIAETGSVDPMRAVLVLLAALCAHASVNLLNEYADWRSGLDATTDRTPFSGGSGALQVAPPGADRAVLTLGVFALLLSMGMGAYFLIDTGIRLLPIGVLGALVIVAYSPWLNRMPLLCLVAPGLGFGPLMVVGTALVLGAENLGLAILASLPSFFLSNNLLLLNQFPDREADQAVGRRHVPIVYGQTTALVIYAVFIVGALISLMTGVLSGGFQVQVLVAVIPLLLSIPILKGMSASPLTNDVMVPHLGKNVALSILTPAVLGVAMVV